MIKNLNNKLYVGITKNIRTRLRTHNSGRGAYFTYKGNFKLVFQESYPTMIEARKREIQIKKWRRDKKEFLIEKFSKGLNTKM